MSYVLRPTMGMRILLALALCAMLISCAPPELPDAWPQALPLYPGAILTGASHKVVLDGSAQYHGAIGSKPATPKPNYMLLLLVELRTVDEPQAVLQFYADASLAAGYIVDHSRLPLPRRGQMQLSFCKQEQRFTISAWVDERRTRHNRQNLPRVTKARLALYLPQE